MGLCSSRSIVDGALIVDSVVITNRRVHFSDRFIDIPIKSLSSNESASIKVDRKAGTVEITRGFPHGRLSHNALVDDIESGNKESYSV